MRFCFCILGGGGEQALKLGLHRKFSDHLALVREAMKIFLRSSVLLMVLVCRQRDTVNNGNVVAGEGGGMLFGIACNRTSRVI